MILCESSCAVHFLLDDDPVVFATNGSLQALDAVAYLRNEFQAMRPAFRRQVQLITDSFFNAYVQWQKSDSEIEVIDPIVESGTFIKPTSVGTNTMFYDLTFSGTKGNWTISGTVAIFGIIGGLKEPTLVCYLSKEEDTIAPYIASVGQKQGVSAETYRSMIVRMILFIKNCVGERKLINTGGTLENDGRIYQNDTKFPVEVLHCRSFHYGT